MMVDLESLGHVVEYTRRYDGLYNAWVRTTHVMTKGDANIISSQWVVVDVVDPKGEQ